MGFAKAKCKHGFIVAGMPSPDYDGDFIENAQKLFEFGDFCYNNLKYGKSIEFTESNSIEIRHCKDCWKEFQKRNHGSNLFKVEEYDAEKES